jgi:hypothetical protein
MHTSAYPQLQPIGLGLGDMEHTLPIQQIQTARMVQHLTAP